jgi:putative ABC transport system permease protein
MLLVARKNLFSERTRLAISVGGVALSVFLISILLSLYRGWDEKVGEYVEVVPADLWVASEGATDFIQAASILPDAVRLRLELLPEVDTVSPLIVRPLQMTREGQPRKDAFDVQLVGYDPAIGLGGPLKVVEGKSPPGPGEIVVDQAMADRFGVAIGDRLVRGAESLTVVGFSAGGDFVFTQVAFVTLDTAADFLSLEPPSQRTFFLVTLNDPSQKEAVAQRLEAGIPGVMLASGHDFANETRQRLLGNILPMLIVVLIVAFIVGLAVAGLTIYTATVEKSREYGILKAEGFSNRFLYRVVFAQSLVTSAMGFILGAGLTLFAGPFARDIVPQFVVLIRWQDMLGITGITLIMALIAAYIPVRRIAQIDPVTVFKG